MAGPSTLAVLRAPEWAPGWVGATEGGISAAQFVDHPHDASDGHDHDESDEAAEDGR
jgi:hypothetical protein